MRGKLRLEVVSHDELLALNGRYKALYDLQIHPSDMPGEN